MTVLEVQAVNKIHKNKHIIQDVSFSMNEGECKVIVCNKEIGQILIELLFNLTLPTSGEVFFRGEVINIQKQSKEIGLFMLDDGIYERMTVTEYLTFFHQVYKSNQSIDKTLERAGLFDKQKERVAKLSFSEVRRLHLARAVIHNPTLVVLEEPEQNVDVESIVLIRKNIETLRQDGKAILITTSSLEVALSITNDVYILNEEGFKEVKSEEEEQQDATLVESKENVNVEMVTPIRIDKIPAKVNEKLILFDPMEIYFVESQEGNSYIHVKEGRFLCTFTLNELQEKLKPFGFFRCHRSYIINLQRVREVITWTRNSYSLILDNKEKSSVPLSKGRYEELKEIVGL
jgi:ABC-2 type transport system ATP-binding protein